jgi:nitroreductase
MMMDFYETVYSRSSIRSYKADPVPEELVNKILDAARWAPSWRNLQCWHFIVVRDTDIIKELQKTGTIYQAPVYIVAAGDPELSGKKRDQQYYMVDVAIALEHLILAAAAEGLGTCWIGGRFDEEKVKKVLNIPENIRVVAITPLGYPAETEMTRKRERKPLEEIVRRDHW